MADDDHISAAERVMDSLAMSLSRVTEYLLALKAANAAPPETLPQKGGIVTQATNTLVTVAHSTGQQFALFPKIQKEIDDEADKIATHSEGFGKALVAIQTEDDHAAGYSAIMEECKHICSGTSYLLILVYGARVRAILEQARRCKEAVNRWRQETIREEVPEQGMIDRVQELAGADMLVALLGLVGSRIQDLKADGEDDEVAILTDLYNRLNDSRQDDLNAVNGWIGAPVDPAAKKTIIDQCEASDALLDELVLRVKPPKALDVFAQMGEAFRATQKKLRDASARAARAVDNVNDNERDLMAAAAALAKSGSVLAGDLADHPESYDFDAASFATTLASFNDAGVAAVKGETHPDWVPDMEAAIAAVTAAAEKLADASEHAHQNPIDKNASDAVDAASVELSEAIDALITRAVKARADAEAEERARAEAALAAQLQAAADEAARLAAEAAAREQRKKDAAERIKAALFALGDCPDLGLDGFGDLLAAANALGNAVGSLVGDAPEAGGDKVATDVQHMNSLLDRLLSTARGIKMDLDDDSGAALQGHLDTIKDLIGRMDTAATTLTANPSPEADEEVAAIDEAIAAELESLAHDFAAFAGRPHSDDKIGGVADSLASHIAHNFGDQGDEYLVEKGLALIELMRRLAEAVRSGDGSAIIAIAREIQTIAKEAAKAGREIAKTCTDQRLKTALMDGVNGLGNFAVQLKIIASVAALNTDSAAGDDATENQLITCCQGISKSFQYTIDAGLSAKIRA